MLSKQTLLKQAKEQNYKPEILEKVQKLLLILEQFMSVPYLQDRLVLKGGTALNLFHFDPIPRLSVDIDLNYIGHPESSIMLEERKIINEAITKIFLQNQFEQERSPTKHAGGKTIWRYNSALGQKGNLEIDLNYMFRIPLWPIRYMAPRLHFGNSFNVPVLDLHELAAGKLAALFARRVSRDFFDSHYLLTKCKFDTEKLRTSFIIYTCMSDANLGSINFDAIHYDVTDIRNKLIPVLRQEALPRKKPLIEDWANQLLLELKEQLASILPLTSQEMEFIKLIREQGQIMPNLITEDKKLISIVLQHPLIQWKAQLASKLVKER